MSLQMSVAAGLGSLNNSLELGGPASTLAALKALASYLPPLMESAAPLYHEEMAANRLDADEDLSLREVKSGVRFVSTVARVNIALEKREPCEIWQVLSTPSLHLQGVERAFSEHYFTSMAVARANKIHATCPLLTYCDLQELIDQVNVDNFGSYHKKESLLQVINEGIDNADTTGLTTSLKALRLSQPVSDHDTLHYYQLLRDCKHKLTEENIGLEDIHQVLERAHLNSDEASKTSTLLMQINKAARQKDKTIFVNNILLNGIWIDDVLIMFQSEYIEKIINEIFRRYDERRLKVNKNSSWITYQLTDGSQVYFNVETGAYQWSAPNTLASKYHFLTLIDLKDIQDTVINKHKDEEEQAKVKLIVSLQANCRGWLLRQKLQQMRKSTLIIQTWWRMCKQRRVYKMYRMALKMSEPYIIVLQRAVRDWLKRKKMNVFLSQFHEHEKSIICIQRHWRLYKTRKNLQSLTVNGNPPLSVIRNFLHHLDVSEADFDEVPKLQHLKSEMVQMIRRTQHLEKQVDALDVKIGLLVHNHINMTDDILLIDKENMSPNVSPSPAMGNGVKSKHRGSRELLRKSTMRIQKGLKALTKESREKLLGYQHLFYLLQTQPHYLATLIFAIPPGKTTQFIENVIFTLYNYGANDRDNYLLLKLFKTALEEEIRCKVLRISDINTGNPMVVKMIVAFNRSGHGQAALRDMLAPLINRILFDNTLQMNTNPVEIYRHWVNTMEIQTGQPSGLPYEVSQEQAMKYTEVTERLNKAIILLKDITATFCDHITGSIHLIPFAMLYMAKVMKSSLQRRFPHILEKDILKTVGNLIYYRYINSAIVAPDAFDIITVNPDQKLNNNQRRNLASIAKILQFAAQKKGFGEEASHLMVLNPFIIECHEKFKDFFQRCCEVEEPESLYNVTQYSEATLIVKPTIYITLQEILETHQLLLDHKEILAPDIADPLHLLLKNVGECPSLESLAPDSSFGKAGRTEICLSLTNKFEVADVSEDKDPKDPMRLFNKTKKLLVDIIRCVDGEHVTEIIACPTIAEQDQKYRALITSRSEQQQQASQLNNTVLSQGSPVVLDSKSSLHQVKTRLIHNLRRLETQGLTSKSDNYQTLRSAIASTIINLKQHRTNRKIQLHKLLITAQQLEKKEKFYKEQQQSYQTYLKTCLNNMALRNKNVHAAINDNNTKSKGGKTFVKYTAVRLQEKGVLLEIEDLPDIQLRNVLFEISPLAQTGIFQVQVKFMNVPMELVELDIQELLKLQYEGVSVSHMFRKVKVNVNLLIHLLNTKFYSRRK